MCRANVVDFVAVRAQAIHKDNRARIAALSMFNSKQLVATTFNRLQSIVLSALGAEGRGFESLRPDHSEVILLPWTSASTTA